MGAHEVDEGALALSGQSASPQGILLLANLAIDLNIVGLLEVDSCLAVALASGGSEREGYPVCWAQLAGELAIFFAEVVVEGSLKAFVASLG
jgi:hypothetical protein